MPLASAVLALLLASGASASGERGFLTFLAAGPFAPPYKIYVPSSLPAAAALLSCYPDAFTAQAARVREVLVDGLGHAWSGGAPGASATDPRGPDATAMMWSFFSGRP